MRLSISVSFFAMLVGIASACKSGEYACGSGDIANTIMLCNEKGIPVPVNECGGGLRCKTIDGRVLCA